MAAIPPEDEELMNLITLKGAKDLYGKAKGTGLFNLEQDFDLQNLSKLSKFIHKNGLDHADKIQKDLTGVTGIVTDTKNLKNAFRDFNKLQNLDQFLIWAPKIKKDM